MAAMTDPIAKAKARSDTPGFAVSAAERYAKQLRRYLFRRLGGPQEVDDLAQEVYLKLLRVNTEIQLREPLAFVYSVAARVLASHRAEAARERANVTSADDAPDEWSDRVSDALSDRLEESFSVQQQIEKALSLISPTHAAVLLMIKRDGLSYEEVAARLELSVHTVHKYLQEGRAQIRKQRFENKGD